MSADAASRLRQLLALMPWLVEQRRVPIAKAAARAGMSEADLVALLERAACCGLPPYTPDQLIDLIVSEGTVEARAGSHLQRPLRLSPAEGFALATAARALLSISVQSPVGPSEPGQSPAGPSEPDHNGPLARALAKLEKALGAHSALAVKLAPPEHLLQAQGAVERSESVTITYHSAAHDEMTDRTVDPLAVYTREGHWYMDGYCHLAQGLRHFRLDRVRQLRPTGERFERRQTTLGLGDPLPGGEGVTVTMIVPPEGRWVLESYPTIRHREIQDGKLEIELSVSGQAWLKRLLLRLGPQARVVEPPELRTVAQQAARDLLELYR